MMYCAFLRGVNVNGRNMKMDEVCGIFRRAGVDRVSSVLATGNIIFQSDMAASELYGPKVFVNRSLEVCGFGGNISVVEHEAEDF